MDSDQALLSPLAVPFLTDKRGQLDYGWQLHHLFLRVSIKVWRMRVWFIVVICVCFVSCCNSVCFLFFKGVNSSVLYYSYLFESITTLIDYMIVYIRKQIIKNNNRALNRYQSDSQNKRKATPIFVFQMPLFLDPKRVFNVKKTF